eukprot:GDKI01044955.1.p1 GENE.GDKI01044955.1~~GDKI01044955.1.p1  ORF type:complete len:444 (-),score=82.12 GDKI01044955.1:191-1390(-)
MHTVLQVFFLGALGIFFVQSVRLFFFPVDIEDDDTKKDKRRGFGAYLSRYFEICTELLAAMSYKSQMAFYGALFMVFSGETKKSKSVIPLKRLTPAEADKVEVKTVILFRHGESLWNFAFNRGWNLTFPLRLLQLLSMEYLLWPLRDSAILDSPLSALGVQQACEVRALLEGEVASPGASSVGGEEKAEREKVMSVLRGDSGSSVLVASNLRRALSTVLVAFNDRIKRTQERVHIHSSTQELTRNADGLSLSVPNGISPPPFYESPQGGQVLCKDLQDLPISVPTLYNKYTDTSCNFGNKQVKRRVHDSLREFAAWCFDNTSAETVILGGHSAWIRYFFRNFLPSTNEHQSKASKLSNCGLVQVKLQRLTKGRMVDYYVDPADVKLIHGHWEKASKFAA